MRPIFSNINIKCYRKAGTASISLCLLFSVALSLSAQDSIVKMKRMPFDYDQIFSTNYWNFYIRPSVIFVSDAHFYHPPLQFEQQASPMISFGWMYQINLKESWQKNTGKLIIEDNKKTNHLLDRWAIQTGIGISLCRYFFNYSMPASYSGFNEGIGAPQKLYDEQVLNIPVYAVYKLPFYDCYNSWLATFTLGVDINIEGSTLLTYGDIIGEPNGPNNKTAFELQQQTSFRGYTAYPSFHASAGLNYILPDKNMLNLQIVGNYSPFYSQQGTFAFMPGTPQEVDGIVVRRLSCIGFELNYIFTRVRHMKLARPGYRIPPVKKL